MGDFFGGYTASALRSLIVLLMLVPIALATRQLTNVYWRRDWPYFATLVFTACFIWGPLYYSILHAGVGISLAVNYASIVLGMFLFGWLLLKERLTKEKIIAGTLGIAGLALIFSPEGAGVPTLSLFAAVVSGLSGSAHMVTAKKLPYNSTQSTIFVWTASFLANIPMAFAFDPPFSGVAWRAEWFYLFLFAVASIAASWTFVKGVKLMDSGIAGVLGLMEIVFGVALGAIFFDERPTFIVLTGVIVIIVAASIPYFSDLRGTTSNPS